MLAVCIKAGVRDPQPLNRTTSYDVSIDNFVDILQFHPPVPHSLGINHYSWAVLALVEASGLIGANLSL